MHILSILGLCGCALLTAVSVGKENEVLIPLREIWGYEMPGTRNIEKLKPKPQMDVPELIQQSLMRHDGDPAVGPGFVVQGDESEALLQAFAVLVSHKEASSTVTHDLNTWIVFFAKDSGQYVHLRSVTRAGNKITVDFTFVPHDSKNLTRHFALIPLGKLPTGKYEVAIVNSPMDKRYLDQHFKPIPKDGVRWIVAKSFDFDVSE
jgi:hypothetical protein